MRLCPPILAAVASALALAGPAGAQLPLVGGPGEQAPEAGVTYENPVLPGDYPDPSVIRDGADYWAVATSGGWSPPFTLLTSRDLVNWVVAGTVLRRAPRWASRDFWAPEIVKRGRGYLVYYAAHDRRGRFCVGVASARRPTRFFRDRGRVVCSAVGAIDPATVLDEHGTPYLVWKEDGNSRGQPTPVLAAPLTRSGLRLAGAPHELIRNDQAWEGHVVEAPALTRHEGRFYLFYSARNCCGPHCDYALGVARSPALLGPWEKHTGPVLRGGPGFRCPGHGSVVSDPGGGQHLLYHAYFPGSSPGRQVLLDQFDWGSDGWPRVGDDGRPSMRALSPFGTVQQPRPQPFSDEFRTRFLTAGWNWSGARPRLELRRGRLYMAPHRGHDEAAIGRQPGSTAWQAATVVGPRRRGTAPGIAALADPGHALGVDLRGGRAVAWRRDGEATTVLGSVATARHRGVALRIRSAPGGTYAFELRGLAGWVPVARPVPSPTWGDDTRIVLRVAGGPGARAAFEGFTLGPLGG
jgi:xylan 1,4-beta-xylosidase